MRRVRGRGHRLEQCLDENIAAAGIAGEPDAPLFQTAGRHAYPLSGAGAAKMFVNLAKRQDFGCNINEAADKQ
jgi:hypothetical protein